MVDVIGQVGWAASVPGSRHFSIGSRRKSEKIAAIRVIADSARATASVPPGGKEVLPSAWVLVYGGRVYHVGP